VVPLALFMFEQVVIVVVVVVVGVVVVVLGSSCDFSKYGIPVSVTVSTCVSLHPAKRLMAVAQDVEVSSLFLCMLNTRWLFFVLCAGT